MPDDGLREYQLFSIVAPGQKPFPKVAPKQKSFSKVAPKQKPFSKVALKQKPFSEVDLRRKLKTDERFRFLDLLPFGAGNWYHHFD